MNLDSIANLTSWFAAGVNLGALLHCALHHRRPTTAQYVYYLLAVAVNAASASRLILNQEYGKAVICALAIAALAAAWITTEARADMTPVAGARRTRGPRRYH